MLRFASIYGSSHGSFLQPINVLKSCSIGKTVVDSIETFNNTDIGNITLACLTAIPLGALHFNSMNVDFVLGSRLQKRLLQQTPAVGPHVNNFFTTCLYYAMGGPLAHFSTLLVHSTCLSRWLDNPIACFLVFGTMMASWYGIQQPAYKSPSPYMKHLAWITSCFTVGALREAYEVQIYDRRIVELSILATYILFGGSVVFLVLRKPLTLFMRETKTRISIAIGLTSALVSVCRNPRHPTYFISAAAYLLCLVPAYFWQVEKVKNRADAYYYNDLVPYDPIYQSHFLILSSLAITSSTTMCLVRFVSFQQSALM